VRAGADLCRRWRKACAAGSFLGARLTRLYVPGQRLKQLFGLLIVVVTAYRIFTMAV
jgi:uncharacterized membrane protein YfcA